ncbi:MAG: hypothetical protein ABIA04_09340 [Pseudomonadota bacterium]
MKKLMFGNNLLTNLTQKGLITLILFVFLSFLVHFLYGDDVVKLKDLFSHKNHLSSFKKKNIHCSFCHIPHKNRKEIKLETKCISCHETGIAKVIPRDHNYFWKSKHANKAQLHAGRCNKCHKTSDCTACHSKRDKVKRKYHNNNFIFYHSIKVRKNPYKCIRCHKTNYCTDCHNSRGVNYE